MTVVSRVCGREVKADYAYMYETIHSHFERHSTVNKSSSVSLILFLSLDQVPRWLGVVVGH